ncbi:MAG: Ribose-phosphate pyrophosphokinase [Candidatus Bathyarchaeota archaeon BA1]|nr:MAG: Ribose-phosphate pyrophosphokinase [Candidatus Bathyarchaeota archaeon BA1]
MLIMGGSASSLLAMKVAHELGKNVSKLEVKRFPDGEKYLRVLDDVNGRDVVVIQSMYHKPDEYLFEYLLLADALRDLGANRVIAVIPYLAYARQDERFIPGEAISFQTVSRLIESVGTNEIYTIDTHLHRVLDISKTFKITAHNLSAIPTLTNYIKENFTLNKPMVIGPDEEAEQWAKIAAKGLNTEYDVLEKRRLGPDRVEVKPRRLEIKDRDVVIIDDIISTGGTVLETIRVARKEGARKIIAACTHPVLVDNALEKIYEEGADAVIGSDTIPSPISFVSVALIIAKALTKEEK